MNKRIRTIGIIGDGGWGTTLAVHLAHKKHHVSLWGPFPEYLQKIKKTRRNPKFLPGIVIPKAVGIEPDLRKILSGSDLIVLAIPSQFLRPILKKIQETRVKLSQKIFLSVIKGVDNATLLRMSQIIHKELGNVPLAVLSGPTIAVEVAKKIPSTAVIACHNLKIAEQIQAIFHSDHFRIYTNTDIIGVELGGSVKNIIAIACGVCDGLNFGTNTKAAILTRGLAEMARLGEAMGAKTRTFSGLTGLGDLVTTCTSLNSRNRHVGEQLGKGKTIKQITASMDMIAEGVETSRAVYKLSKKYKIPMPITQQVYEIIFKGKKPYKAVKELMSREVKQE